MNKHLSYPSGEKVPILDILRLKKGVFLSNTGEYQSLVDKQACANHEFECIQGHFYENPDIKSMIIRPDGIVTWVVC